MEDKERALYILTRMRGWHNNWGLGFEETTGMVSSAVKMDEQDVIKTLKRLRADHKSNLKYKELRKDLPKRWPI